MKSLFVPSQMVAVFKSTTRNIKSWTDPAFLQGILSPNDVAIYIMANIRSHELIGSDLTQSFPNCLVLESTAAFRGLSREIDIELQRQGGIEKYDPQDQVPVIVHFDGTHVVFSLSDRIDGVCPIEAIINTVGSSFAFENLAKLPIFATYLTSLQKKQH